MICAGEFKRLKHIREAQFFQPLGRKVEVLETPTNLLAGQRLVAVLLLGGTNRFYSEHRVDQAAVVEDLSDSIGAGRLILRHYVLVDIGMYGKLAGGMLKHQRLVSDSLIARGNHVWLGT